MADEPQGWQSLDVVNGLFPGELNVYWRLLHSEDFDSKKFLFDPLGDLKGEFSDLVTDGWTVTTSIIGHEFRIWRWPVIYFLYLRPEAKHAHLVAWKRDPRKDPTYDPTSDPIQF